MTATKIELPHRRIRQLSDASDLAELLFPGNRNQQHAFLVLWTALKWSRAPAPDLAALLAKHQVSKRTLERVRAKLSRLGLIEHVSALSARYGYRAGWAYSPRFERSLQLLAERVAVLRDPHAGSREKDEFALQLAAARKSSRSRVEND